MVVWLIVSGLVACLYLAMMLRYWWSWRNYPATFFPPLVPKTKVTVLIPARNEENNILNVLTDLSQQTYPASFTEILVLDDHSEDKTADLVLTNDRKNVRLIQLANFKDEQGNALTLKKKAIELGVSQASNELIIVTDADCRLPKEWIENYVSVYQQKGSKMMAGPVFFQPAHSIFEQFQALDFMGMMGITVAYFQQRIFNMCNGSNLAYEKAAFQAVEGYKGIDHVASGDDMLLIYKIEQQFPGKVTYLKNPNAAVLTRPESGLSAFFQQRIRWTSKAGAYQDKRISRDLTLALAFNIFLLTNLFLFLFIDHRAILVFVPQIICKFVVEWILLNAVSRFYKLSQLMDVFIPSQFLHIAYIVVIGLLGVFLPYRWKGRKINK
ncbi:MAG: glycosyltransferase [Chitinophagales bacterium]|nr:glycosyltransferase [Chitinophagales bacterium]